MTVREFIQKLQTFDLDAEVVNYDAENAFYSASTPYSDVPFPEGENWISLEESPQPKRIVLV